MADLSLFEWAISQLQSLLTSAAIIVGGAWAWFRFRRHRRAHARARLMIIPTHPMLSADKRLLHIALRIENEGEVLLPITYAEICVRQVVPVPPKIASLLKPNIDPVPLGRTELPWPQIVGREWDEGAPVMCLEPGESEGLHTDFVLEADVAIVELYAFVRQPASRTDGWTETIIVEFSGEAGMSEEKDVVKRIVEGTTEQRVQKQQAQQPQQQSTQKPSSQGGGDVGGQGASNQK